MPSTSIRDLVPQQIARLTVDKLQRLAFPPPLEDRFEEDTRQHRSKRLWAEGLAAIAFFNLFLFLNHFLVHTTSLKSILLRTGLITPIALLVNFSMRLNPHKVYREASIALAACWICFVHLYLEQTRYAMGPAYAQVGVIVAVLFVNVVMRLRFRYALAASAAMTGADIAFMYRNGIQGAGGMFFGVSLTMCAVAMTLMANYSLSREERLGYLIRLRGELQSAALSIDNRELERLSRRDELTGVANRHAFGNQYMRMWQQAIDSQTPLSALLVDIDHFKTVNDQCGHLYGDQVLQRLALLLQEALRGKADFVARFGGDEFVVLLPNTPPEAAMRVAERIRQLVELAGSPAIDETSQLPSVWATVSCGVATCWPMKGEAQSPLIEAADKALYKAKANGRNCVSFSEQVTSGVS